MRKILLILGVSISVFANAQTKGLSVEKIMKDIKWIGSSPSNISWSWDNKSVFFNWNPDKNVADSFYIYKIATKQIEKLNYNEAQKLRAINAGVYNKNYSAITYNYKGDIYLLNTTTGITIPITQTEEMESNPSFIANDEWVVYKKNRNLFAWQIKTGFTKQLTNFVKELDRAPKSNMTAQDLFLQNFKIQYSNIILDPKYSESAYTIKMHNFWSFS
jgi:hypothetical protein